MRFDAEYRVLGRDLVSTLSSLDNRGILGIATNPRDPPDPVRIYVAHSALLSAGCGDPSRPYTGQVSRLTGPDFDVVEPIVTGLPASGGTHAVNGIEFDDAGDLLIAVGSLTNAGVPHCASGGLPDSPLSGAVLIAATSKADFNGEVVYLRRNDGSPSEDQTDGGEVDVAPGVDVRVFAAGFRNPFDVVVTQSGRIYGTDNGPNVGDGPASLSATEHGPDPGAPDEINTLVADDYYGHPNRNRGAYDARQNVYRGPDADATNDFTQALVTLPSSTDGITEYTSAVLGGVYRGSLIAQQWDGATYLIRLAGDGRTVASHTQMPFELPGLDVTAGPAGALLGIDFSGNAVWLAQPEFPEEGAPMISDVFPPRIHGGHDTQLVISGWGFAPGSSASIGDVRLHIDAVGPSSIRATMPAHRGTGDYVDVTVERDGYVMRLPDAVRLLW